jgi:DNA polymerase I-like protein with 3'-5' exonuclease and polymerase domains
MSKWCEVAKAQARRSGYITTITGRKRFFGTKETNNASGGGGPSKPSWQDTSRIDRQAVNSIIQGSASDVMKLAMVRVQQACDQWVPSPEAAGGPDPTHKPRMLIQIHDELVLECRDTPVSTPVAHAWLYFPLTLLNTFVSGNQADVQRLVRLVRVNLEKAVVADLRSKFSRPGG